LKKKPVEPATWTQGNSQNLDEACGGLCVVAFVKDYDTEKTVLDTILDKFQRDKKFKFVWVAASETALKGKFSIETEPTALVYNSRRQRVAQAASFDDATISQLLERTLGGDVQYKAL